MMDFEDQWLEKLSLALGEARGAGFRDSVMSGAGEREVIRWTVEVMEKLNSELSAEELHDVMTSCACHYPASALEPVREAFAGTGSFTLAMDMLREQFRENMEKNLGIPDEVVENLLARGMGPAGVLEENRIVATKIPKSGNLMTWLSEEDPGRRREIYCHCPRVNRALEQGIPVPDTYCLCGAGFYRDIWETITGKPVRVEVLRSVMNGDDTCSIAVYPEALRA
ncbi:MAG TPA: hypothetical protein PLM22_03265 [Candidatus Sabulitectum sp.]|nr:hypothetical protein [Candidatus Sabulitectum sp.]HPJ27926.1 hypothetical protein [Candidatus Sabulitectum sp.]HPR21729.1 hypothetical protein [Candidatus Sabulitectum sp.]HRW77982.1 hypothetical protein [Candidatus Sabulitectum sp.]